MADKPVAFVFGHNQPNGQTPFHVTAWESINNGYYLSVVTNPTTQGSATGTCTETQPASETNWDDDADNDSPPNS